MAPNFRMTRSIFIVAILTLSVCGFARGGGAAAFRQADNESAARNQVLSLFTIFKSRDWKSLWGVVQFSPAVATATTDPEAFARDVAKGIKDADPDDNFGKLFGGMSDIGAGGVVIEGDRARVATSCKVTNADGSVILLGVATLVKVDGIWKWDLSASDDTEKITGQRLQEMLGSPIQIQK